MKITINTPYPIITIRSYVKLCLVVPAVLIFQWTQKYKVLDDNPMAINL